MAKKENVHYCLNGKVEKVYRKGRKMWEAKHNNGTSIIFNFFHDAIKFVDSPIVDILKLTKENSKLRSDISDLELNRSVLVNIIENNKSVLKNYSIDIEKIIEQKNISEELRDELFRKITQIDELNGKVSELEDFKEKATKMLRSARHDIMQYIRISQINLTGVDICTGDTEIERKYSVHQEGINKSLSVCEDILTLLYAE